MSIPLYENRYDCFRQLLLGGGVPDLRTARAEKPTPPASDPSTWSGLLWTGGKRSSSSGPRASCALRIMSAQDARGPKEHDHDSKWGPSAALGAGSGPRSNER